MATRYQWESASAPAQTDSIAAPTPHSALPVPTTACTAKQQDNALPATAPLTSDSSTPLPVDANLSKGTSKAESPPASSVLLAAQLAATPAAV